MEKLKLFCLPFAGGTASTYISWKKYMEGSIELKPIELSGRGKRFGESLCNNISEVVDDVFDQIHQDLNSQRYAFFGHSMGALIIYELMNKIKQKGCNDPEHIFFSGRFPPHIKDYSQLHILDDSEFISEVYKLGGIPEELMKYDELLQLIIPVLKADYKVVETYKHIEKKTNWNFDISVFYGSEDSEIEIKHAFEWKKYTAKDCSVFKFEGDHFFINENIVKITEIINNRLTCKELTGNRLVEVAGR